MKAILIIIIAISLTGCKATDRTKEIRDKINARIHSGQQITAEVLNLTLNDIVADMDDRRPTDAFWLALGIGSLFFLWSIGDGVKIYLSNKHKEYEGN